MAGGSVAYKETWKWKVWPSLDVAVPVVAFVRSAMYASRSRRIQGGGRLPTVAPRSGGVKDSGKIIGLAIWDHWDR
jgi:hypothetical protein